MADYTIKAGSTYPPVRCTITWNGTANLAGAAVEMKYSRRGDATVTTKTCSIVDADAGIVEYSWQAGETDLVGEYDVEWWITLAGGQLLKAPATAYERLIFTDDLP